MFPALILATSIQVSGQQWVTPAVRAPGVAQHRLTSKTVKAEVTYHVFLPHDYEASPQKRFPVLYWLHGSGGGLAGIQPVSQFFDAAMRTSKLPSMVIVFPNSLKNGMWCDSADGTQPIESIVVKELVPEIDHKFRTLAKREGRIVEGFSMGGYGAARFGFKFTKTFSGISVLAGGPLDLEFKGPKVSRDSELRDEILTSVYGGSMDQFRSQSPWTIVKSNVNRLKKGVTIRICVGEDDFTLPANRAFSEHLKTLAIPHEFTSKPGVGHDTLGLLRALGEHNWEFYKSCLTKYP